MNRADRMMAVDLRNVTYFRRYGPYRFIERNVHHSKPGVRNRTAYKCVLETVTAVTVTRVAALSLSVTVSTVPKNIVSMHCHCH